MTRVGLSTDGLPQKSVDPVHKNGAGEKLGAGGGLGDGPQEVGPTSDHAVEKRSFRSKIPSPRSSPRTKPSVKTYRVYANGDKSGAAQVVIMDFSELEDWDDFLSELYQSLDFTRLIQSVFTVKGGVLDTLEEVQTVGDLVVGHGEPFRLGAYAGTPLPMSRSVQLRPTQSPLSSGKGRRSARSAFTKSVLLDTEEYGRTGHPLTKTFSEQNVSSSTESPGPVIPQSLSPRPRPVSCYSATSVNSIPEKKLTQLVSNSRIPKRILPVVNAPDLRNPTYNVTNPSIELQTLASSPCPSPRSNANRFNGARVEPVQSGQSSAPSKSNASILAKDRPNRQVIARRDFVRPRLVTIIRSGMKPRKVSRYLLNQRTARSLEQVLSDITGSVKPDWGAIRKVYALSGTAVINLEDFFKEERIFLVCPNDRVGPDDFQLDDLEVKAIQPFMEVPALAMKGKESKSPQRRPKPAVRPPQERTPPMSYPTHPKFIPLSKYPSSMVSRYCVGAIIGDGNFAVVRECTHRQNNAKYALKVIDKTKSGRDAPPDHEVTILKSVTHPNIILLYEQFDCPTELYVIMEFIAGGDLFDTIATSIKFSEEESACMTKDIASALSFLHSRGIVHRDVKPENLLVYHEGDGQNRLKLGDFGLAQFIEDGNPLFTICGTPTYVAPEILAETGYGLKVDIWAMGIILYILLCGYPPFVSPTGEQEDLFDLILIGDYEFPSEHWDSISEDGKDLIMRMIESDVDLRLEADEVMEHPWLASNAEDCDAKRNRFFRKDFKFSVFEQMGLTKLSHNLLGGPFSSTSASDSS